MGNAAALDRNQSLPPQSQQRCHQQLSREGPHSSNKRTTPRPWNASGRSHPSSIALHACFPSHCQQLPVASSELLFGSEVSWEAFGTKGERPAQTGTLCPAMAGTAPAHKNQLLDLQLFCKLHVKSVVEIGHGGTFKSQKLANATSQGLLVSQKAGYRFYQHPLPACCSPGGLVHFFTVSNFIFIYKMKITNPLSENLFFFPLNDNNESKVLRVLQSDGQGPPFLISHPNL